MIWTCFPDWPREKLERIARGHAIEISLAYGRPSPDHGSVDRLNMLRHEFTDYDDDQSQKAHRQACEAIKARYPWLADECDRQVDDREAAEREETDLYEAAARLDAAWEAAERQRREERSRTSAEAIFTMKVGDKVAARIGGHERSGTITWVGRLRVEVSYGIKTGEGRSRRLYASDIREAAIAP